jgi:hypothetical protein
MIPNKQKFNWEKYYFRFEGVSLFFNIFGAIALLVQIIALIFFARSLNLLLLYFNLVWAFGGFFVINTETKGMFYDSLISSAVRFFYKQPQNKYTFLKLQVTGDKNYTLDNLREFFYYVHSSQQFSTYTFEKQLNYGVGSYEACFDIIVNRYDVEVYLAVATLNLNYFQKAFEYHLPNIKYEASQSPFKNLPRSWSDKTGAGGYQCLAGMCLGYTMPNVFHSDQMDLEKDSNFPIDNLIEQIQKQLLTQTVYLQYVFSFENRKLQDGIRPDVAKFRQKNYERFSLREIKAENNTEILEVLLPDIEKEKMARMEKRVKESSELVSCNIKVMSLCTTKEYSETEKILERALRGNQRKTNKDQNEIEIIYYTATNQRYFNLSKKPSPNSVPYMNSLYVFPFHWLEPFVSNFYDNIFYYNENKWRRQVMYRRVLKRSGQAPWRNKNTILDLNTLVSVFQIPKTGTRNTTKKGQLSDIKLLKDEYEI